MRDFKIGDRVYYVLPRSPRDGRARTLFLGARIVNITDKRIVIKLPSRRARSVSALSLTLTPPPYSDVRE